MCAGQDVLIFGPRETLNEVARDHIADLPQYVPEKPDTFLLLFIHNIHLLYFSYFSIRSAAFMADAVTTGTPPPGWVEAPTR
jgi:hypothetical protein